MAPGPLDVSSTDVEEIATIARREIGQSHQGDEGLSNMFEELTDTREKEVEAHGTVKPRTMPPPAKRSKIEGPMWSLLEPIWPASERPAALRDPTFIEQQNIGSLMKLHSAYMKKEKQDTGQAISRASKDSKPPKVFIEGGEDDCDEVFTAGRWLRPPISKPDKWYKYIPIKYSTVYRSINFKHILGQDCAVAPQIIAARHDRRNALQMKHFIRSNANVTSKPIREVKSKDADGVSTISDFDWILPANVKQCQDGLINYGAVNQMLWPMDHTTISMTRAFNKYDWCIAAGIEANRVKMIQTIFNR